mmetsp:Transcript_23181/g.66529  ORF Transcript_23181/g.66529 Transcript_23181/m.66529 type:complete len:245 (+) Transcript_23181:267-1001(+)
MKLRALDVDVVLQQALCRSELVERPVHRVLSCRLVVRHVQSGEVLQDDSLLDARALLRVEREHPLDGLNALRRRLRVDGLPRLLGEDRDLLDEVSSRSARWEPFQVLFGRGADYLQYLLDLVEVVLPGEDGFPSDELAMDATNRPNIDGLRVLRRQQHHLRRPVPPRDDIVGQRGIILVVAVAAGQPEVTNLQIAILVDQDVGRLQIAVHNIGAVKVQQSSEDLVREVLVVLVIQHLLGVNHLV